MVTWMMDFGRFRCLNEARYDIVEVVRAMRTYSILRCACLGISSCRCEEPLPIFELLKSVSTVF